MGARHQPPAPPGLFRRIRPGRGIEQRQPRHPARRLAQNLEGQVAAHGKPGQGEAGRRGGQRPRGHAGKTLILGDIGNADARPPGQSRRLVAPQRGIAQQARQQ